MMRKLALVVVVVAMAGAVEAQYDPLNDPDYLGVRSRPANEKKLPTLTLELPSILENDKTKDGWDFLGQVDIVSGLNTLCLVNLYEDQEKMAEGRELFLRSLKADGSRKDQRYAEYLMRHSAQIPKEWRNHFLIFFGTLWRDPKGGTYAPLLVWHSSRWELTFININQPLYLGFYSVHDCHATK